jgi:hypothetical protein
MTMILIAGALLFPVRQTQKRRPRNRASKLADSVGRLCPVDAQSRLSVFVVCPRRSINHAAAENKQCVIAVDPRSFLCTVCASAQYFFRGEATNRLHTGFTTRDASIYGRDSIASPS